MIELIHVAESVAREKNIDKEQVLAAMEEAMGKAGRSKYGYDKDIRATIDRKTGVVVLKRYQTVVEAVNVEEPEVGHIVVAQARRTKPDAQVGDILIDELPPIDFGRIAAQTAKQVIIQKVREAEREKQFAEFKDREGEIINGVVKRVEFGNIIVDLGKAEGLLRRDECIPREHFKMGDRVRTFIYAVRSDMRGAQILLSRTHPHFMAELFRQEVPEIYDGVIEIKAVARDPGSRAKIAVYTDDPSIDPVGACVGMRGSRVQAVVGELQGEKIDIVPWSTDLATFIVNAIAPAEVSKVVLDEEKNRIEIVVPDEQLSLAIGRRGQNVRLASILTGLSIDILTEAEESARRAEEFKVRSALFIQALDVDDVIAHLLASEGFKRVEEIADSDVSELTSIEGFDPDVAAELQNRARTWLNQKADAYAKVKKELGIDDDIETFGFTFDQLIALGNAGIKSREDLADLAGDEMIEILGANSMTEAEANRIIMQAREHWFAGEGADTAAA